MREAFKCAHEIVLVRALLGQSPKNRNLNLALSRVRWMVLQDLDCDDLVGALFPAFHNLTYCRQAREAEKGKRLIGLPCGRLIDNSPIKVSKTQMHTECTTSKKLQHLVLIAARIEHLMFDQLIVTLVVVRRGGLRCRCHFYISRVRFKGALCVW